jgi:hypothetical protein
VNAFQGINDKFDIIKQIYADNKDLIDDINNDNFTYEIKDDKRNKYPYLKLAIVLKPEIILPIMESMNRSNISSPYGEDDNVDSFTYIFGNVKAFKDVEEALDFVISIEKNQNKKFKIIPDNGYFSEEYTYENKKHSYESHSLL